MLWLGLRSLRNVTHTRLVITELSERSKDAVSARDYFSLKIHLGFSQEVAVTNLSNVKTNPTRCDSHAPGDPSQSSLYTSFPRTYESKDLLDGQTQSALTHQEAVLSSLGP